MRVERLCVYFERHLLVGRLQAQGRWLFLHSKRTRWRIVLARLVVSAGSRCNGSSQIRRLLRERRSEAALKSIALRLGELIRLLTLACPGARALFRCTLTALCLWHRSRQNFV